MSTLPSGWTAVALESLCARVQDCEHRTPKYSDFGAPALRPRDVVGGRLDIEGAARVAPEEFEVQIRRYAPAGGDVVYSRELSLGWAAELPPEPAVCLSQGMVVITPGEAVESALLVHYLNGPGRVLADRASVGSAHPHLNLRDIRALAVPISPLAEQSRIVSAIEEAFSKLDAGEAGLKAVRQRLKRMRESVLAEAVTGRLVVQDPSDPPASKLLADLGVECLTDESLPKGWAATTVGAIGTVGTGTTPSRSNQAYWAEGTIPWVSSALLNQAIVRTTAECVTDAALSETSLRIWPAGTLLVAMYGEGKTRGKCAELGIDATCNQACAAILLPQSLNEVRGYLRLLFDASYTANRRLASGGVQPNLNLGLVRGIRVPLPPLAELQRIVAEVDRQFSFIDAAERAIDIGLARSTSLRRSVLKAAFEGRLVPQDPADEPASVLLERIRAERTASPTPKRRRARATA